MAEGRNIYGRKIDLKEALSRIENIYRPWHQALGHQIALTHVNFGMALLVDCHSMPSGQAALGQTETGKRAQAASRKAKGRADFIIGDRFGTSCSKQLSNLALDFLQAHGFAVARNKPYAGGFIAEHYGRPAKGLHALQLEINRSLYVDETSLATKPEFKDIQLLLAELIAELGAACGQLNQKSEALAAE